MRLKTLTTGIVISLAIHAAILILPRLPGNDRKAEAGHIEIGLVYLAAIAPPSSSPQPAPPHKTETKICDNASRPIKKKDQKSHTKLPPAKPLKQITSPKQTVKISDQQGVTPVSPMDNSHNQTVKLNPLQQAVETQSNQSVSAPPTAPPLDNGIPTSSSKIPSPTTDFANAANFSMPQQVIEAHSPRYHINPPPDYPALALKRRWQGEVWLRVLVGEQGEVIDAWVENSSGHSLLDESALKTVRNWQFYPGHDGKKKVREEVHLPIRFELEQS